MTAKRVTSLAALSRTGLVAPENEAGLEAVCRQFSVAVTPELLSLIDADDAADPIARQFVPDARELDIAPEERADPIGDAAFSPVTGIVHRYRDRVLLKPLESCAVYCRFCFRRETVGTGGHMLSAAELEAALDYIRAHDEVWEVILTGGDPLILSPRRLRAIIAALEAIPHVEVVRLHTRVPVVEPDRVTPELIEALGSEKAVFVLLHANHPREFTPAAREACRKLVGAGIPMLGQSVLLKGVNDDPAVLEALFRTMVRNRIKPHYLHHPDLARGTGHFRLKLERGQALVRALRGRVSGLCQPTYILDIPGGYGKVPVGPSYLAREGGALRVTDPEGGEHDYPESDGPDPITPS